LSSKVLVVTVAAAIMAAQTASDLPPAPVQPLPFSHKIHVAQGLKCKECHEMPDPGDHAGFPAVSKCMTCHMTIAKDRAAIVKLAKFAKRRESIPWKQVYRLPDYVAFSHKTHVEKAPGGCETCHGPIQERDAIRKEKSIAMGACVDCHKNRGASVACDYCHEMK
jgi:Cytochrome c7 and related cytochrome c/Class III cytochrome C family